MSPGPMPRGRCVWARSGAHCATGDGRGLCLQPSDSQFTPAEEFMVLLSEIDPYLNAGCGERQATLT